MCHRCKERGHVKKEVFSSPNDVLGRIFEASNFQKRLDKWKQKVKKSDVLEMPSDYIRIYNLITSYSVPLKAITWLIDNGVTEADLSLFEMGWSGIYNRVIIPIYDDNKNLMGWVGRRVYIDGDDKSKKDVNNPKYLIRKSKELNDRLKFETKSFIHIWDLKFDHDEIVIYVEDILSAIRVTMATGFKTIALLNTYLDENTILKNKKKIHLVWLDFDQGVNVFNLIKKYNALNIKIGGIWTQSDPKKYQGAEIRRFVTRTLRRTGSEQ
jgi:hypothetical protein